MYTGSVFPMGIWTWNTQLAFECVLIACSLESIRPGLVQGCNLQGPQWCGLGLLDTLFRVRPAPLSSEHGLYALSTPPPGLELTTAPLAQVELHHHY